MNNITGCWVNQYAFWNLGYPTITMDPYLSDVIWQFIGLHANHHRHSLNILTSTRGQINNYFTFATSPNAIFSREKYYCWNFLPTPLHIFACPKLSNSLVNLNHRIVHLSRIAFACSLARNIRAMSSEPKFQHFWTWPSPILFKFGSSQVSPKISNNLNFQIFMNYTFQVTVHWTW
jgi:hypothetical protein